MLKISFEKEHVHACKSEQSDYDSIIHSSVLQKFKIIQEVK